MTASRIAVDLPIRVKPTTTRALGTLGLGLLVALVVGSTIGSGIFGLPQNMAAGAGAILIGWTITGIPAGVRTGSRVRLAGQAEQGQNGGLAGDLYLIVKILPNAIFERDGDDLHFDVPLDIFTAIAGGEIRIPAVEKPLTLTIPPRTNANQSFRIRGKGMPRLGDVKTRGADSTGVAISSSPATEILVNNHTGALSMSAKLRIRGNAARSAVLTSMRLR